MSTDELTYIRKLSNTKNQFKELIKEINLNRALSNPVQEYDYYRQQVSFDGLVEATDDYLTFTGKGEISRGYFMPFEPDWYKLQLWLKLNSPHLLALDSSGHKRNGVMNGIPTVIPGFDNGLVGSVSTAMGFDGIDDWVDVSHDPRLEMDKVLEGFTYHFKFAPCNFDVANGHAQTLFAKKDPTTYRGYDHAIMTIIHPDSSIRTKLTFRGHEYTVVATDFLLDKANRCGITKWYDCTVKFNSVRRELDMLLDNVVYTDEWQNPQTTPYPFHDINWHLSRSTYTDRGLFWGGLADFRFYYDLWLNSQHDYNLFTNRLTISNIPRGHVAIVGHSYIRDSVDIGFNAGYELPKPSGEGFMKGHFMFASQPVDNILSIVYDIKSLPKVENDLRLVYDIEYVFPVSNDLKLVYDIESGTDTDNKIANDLVLSYTIGESTTNPPPQCPQGYSWNAQQQACVQIGGGGGHGGMDSLGLQWYAATGQQDMIPQSKFDTGVDERWSRNYTNLDGGYEVIVYGLFEGTSGGHLAFKIAGGNHSGSCYEVSYGGDTGCGSWYDTGFHMDRSWNHQVERIHTSQQWDWTPQALQLPQLPIDPEGNVVGMRILYYPIKEHGATNDGGIRLMQWVDTSGYLNGKPQNQWQLVFDEIDTGQVMRTPYKPPVDQEVEMRNSDTDTQTLYGGGVHMRRINRATDLPIGSGGGGTLPPTCPQGYHWDSAAQQCKLDTPPVQQCPTGQHWDSGLQQCVPNVVPTGMGIIGCISDTDCVSTSTTIYRLLASHNVKQIIHSGDNVHGSSTSCYFDALAANLPASVIGTNMVTTLGNHSSSNEDGSSSVQSAIANYFGLSSSNNYCRSKQFGNVFIIGLWSNDGSFSSSNGSQYQWLVQQLQQAQGLRNQGLIDWIMVTMHKPFYTPGSRHPADEEGGRDLYQAAFDQYQVDFVWSGHVHVNNASAPLKSGGTIQGTMTGNAYDFKQPHGQIYFGTISGRGTDSASGQNSTFPYVNDTDEGFWLLIPNTTGKSFTIQNWSEGDELLHEFVVNR